MAKYTFYKYTNNTASVVKIKADQNITIPEHTLVTIDADNDYTATVKTTAPVAGDFLVWRPYPNYRVPGDRYGRIKYTPIATSKGELYGFRLKEGDELIVEDAAGITGLTNGQLYIVPNPIIKIKQASGTP